MLDEILDDIYPRKVKLRDRREATLRLLRPEDEHTLYTFFQQIPREDRLFLRDDVTDSNVIRQWCQNIDFSRVVPIVIDIDGRIAAQATLHQEKRGWTSHIGLIRVVVHPDYRRLGIAAILIDEIKEISLHAGLARLNAECMIEQTQAITAFQNAGFIQLAIIPDQVHDLHGHSHDLVILGYDLRADQEMFPGID
jgi:RimJ/RimL family protein N-acetyltransferase